MKFFAIKHFSTFGIWTLLFVVAAALFPDVAPAADLSQWSDVSLPLLGMAGTVDAIFQNRVLTAAVNKIRPVKTHVLDLIFGRKKRQLSSLFSFDIKSSSEQLLENISVSAEAQVTDKTGRKTVTCQAPRFAEKRPISAADLEAMRRFGEAAAPELIKERVADEQSDMRKDVDRTREFMAIKALSGTVVDKNGKVIVAYNFPAEQLPVLAGTDKWTDPDSNPVVNVRGWKKYIGDRVDVDRFVAICGSKAMDALIANPAALELLKYNAGKQLADEGRIAFLAGVSIEEYFGTYKDVDGTRQQLIPENVFALVGIGPDVAAELFAPVVDLKAATGVGSGKAAEVFFSKSWETDDPSARWIKVESRPLPVLFQPECVIWAEVCDA